MGSRKLPKIVRGMGAPAALPASTAIVARAGTRLTMVICAWQWNARNEAVAMKSVVRRSDIRMRPPREEFSAEHGVRQSQSRAAELQNCRRFSPQKAVAKFSANVA